MIPLVSENGKILTSEESLCVFMSEYFKSEKSSVVYDLKSSSIVKKIAEELGSVAIMERSGHAFIKRTFLENNSSLAGEISGHFFFRELGHDDGIYATLKMFEIIKKSGQPLSKLINNIPRSLITPDIRLFWEYEKQDALLDNVAKLEDDYKISKLDGVRVEFPFGWLLVRKSVTEEGITIRIEADDDSALKKIIFILLAIVPELEGRHEVLKR